MEKTIYVILIVLAVAVFGVTQTMVRSEAEEDQYQKRIVETFGDGWPTDDLSYLLKRPALPYYNYPFEPTPEIEYLVYLKGKDKISNLQVLKAYRQLKEEFDIDFYIYGTIGEGFGIFSQEMDAFILSDRLVVGALYVDYQENPLTREGIQRINQLAERLAEEFDMTVQYEIDLETAVAKSEQVNNFYHQYDQWVLLVLRADEENPYSGKEIHDIAYGLGLSWGESNHYHWMNSDEYVGDKHLFSICNYDADGDFIPEDMVAADYTSSGIVIGFYLPTCPAPVEVFENVLTVISSFQSRLGGTIFSIEGISLEEEDIQWMNTVLAEMTQEMEDFGIKPGHNLALWLFN